MITSIRHCSPLARSQKLPPQPATQSFSLGLLPPEPSPLSSKPLYLINLGSIKKINNDPFKSSAYEADRSEPSFQIPDAAGSKLKIGVYFATWWALNVVFNIYNKKVLNAFPYPWLTSTLSLACGSLMMLISWGLRIAETPNTDLDFWKALAPMRKFTIPPSILFVIKLYVEIIILLVGWLVGWRWRTRLGMWYGVEEDCLDGFCWFLFWFYFVP